MTRLRSVVAAIDVSAGSRAVLAEAARIAARAGAALHVVHADVYHRSPSEAPDDAALPEASPSSLLRMQTERLVDGVLAEHRAVEGRPDAGLDPSSVTVSVVRGLTAASAVLCYAGRVGADLLVASLHGRSAVARLLAGSVGEALVAGAQCPVLIVSDEASARAESEDEPVHGGPVLVAADLAARSRDALAAGRAFAALLEAPLELAHVVEGAGPYPAFASDVFAVVDADPDWEANAVARLGGLAAGSPPPAAIHAVQGRPGPAIAALVRERGARLVVVAPHGRSGVVSALVGSTTVSVLRRARAPSSASVHTPRSARPGPPAARPFPPSDSQPAPRASDMLTLQTILFTTDDSDCAEAARPVAERLARHTGATLHVLRVDIVPTTLTHTLRENAPEALAGTTARTGETVEAVRRFPTADYAILDYIREIDADLVVMGTNGRSGLNRAVMGSTAEMVLRRSPCPVLTVGPDASSAGTEGPVLVPVAFESGSDTALETGAAFASAWGVGLVVLHVVEPLNFPVPYALTVAPFDRSGETEQALQVLDRWAGAYAPGKAPVTTRVEQGVVPLRVESLARSLGASLVVQASHGRRGPARWLLGSDAEAVVRTASCPVLTLRSDSQPVTARDGEPMGVAVPRDEWGAFFDALSVRSAAAPHAVSVEVVSPGASAPLYDGVGLLGLTYDARDGAVAVLTADGSHAIARPFSVRSTVDAWAADGAEGADPGPWHIDVVRGDGTRERLTVRSVAAPVAA